MVGVDDIVAFLTARLDEDEAVAKAAGNRHWLVQVIETNPQRDDDGFINWPTRADARHAANWEPARVLREVEAKRRIVAAHPADQNGFKWIDADTRVPDMICATCHVVPEDADYDNCCSYLEYPCPTLRASAAVYVDHPDYNPDWRP